MNNQGAPSYNTGLRWSRGTGLVVFSLSLEFLPDTGEQVDLRCQVAGIENAVRSIPALYPICEKRACCTQFSWFP
jgi:hypothetical protein